MNFAVNGLSQRRRCPLHHATDPYASQIDCRTARVNEARGVKMEIAVNTRAASVECSNDRRFHDCAGRTNTRVAQHESAFLVIASDSGVDNGDIVTDAGAYERKVAVNDAWLAGRTGKLKATA